MNDAKQAKDEAIAAIDAALNNYILTGEDKDKCFDACRRVAAKAGLSQQVEGAISAAIVERMAKGKGRGLVIVRPNLPSAPSEAIEPDIEALNQHHAVIANAGGKTVIAYWGLADPSDPDSRQEISYHGVRDFNLQYSNRRANVQITTRDGMKTESTELGPYWLKHRHRRQYLGIVFVPEAPSSIHDCLNLWRGWGVPEDKPGEWGLIRQHIFEVVCGSNEDYYWYVLSWIAWSLQNPAKPAEVALVLIGDKGVGKGTLARVLQRIFGDHAFALSSPEDLVGRFNHHMQDCLLLIADEIYWTGGARGKDAAGKLQTMITEPKLSVEPKGIDRYQIRNMLHILMLAEPGWVIPAGRHERRFAALDVSIHRREDKAYFRALHAEIAGDGPAAMFAELRGMDLEGWHPRDIPKCLLQSAAMRKQQQLTLPAEEQWYLGLLHEGRLPENFARNRPDCCPTGALKTSAADSSPRLRYSMTDASLRSFLLAKERIGIECVKHRQSSRNGWQFPPLAECREAFDRLYGPIEWDNPVAEWQSAYLGFAVVAGLKGCG